jgi:hypothetical protein
MMRIDYVVANDPDAHLQSSDLAVVYGNSIDPKVSLFIRMLGQKYFGCHMGF